MIEVTGVGTSEHGYMSTHHVWGVAVGAAYAYARHTGLRHVVYRDRDDWAARLWRVAPARFRGGGWLRRRAADLARTGHDWRSRW